MNPAIQNALPANRRVIGPVPPRDKHGRMLIAPDLKRMPKLNAIGEPLRNKEGEPIMEDVDIRPERQYLSYDGSQVPAENATKGLRLYLVDYATEPLHKVYARDEAHAVEVFRKEWGITRFSSEHSDPKATPIQG